MTLGNGTPDDITVTGSLASSIPIKTTYSYDIGSATIALRSVYLGSSDSAARSTRVIGATVASSWTLTLPTGAGTDGYGLVSDGSGTTRWDPIYIGPGTIRNIGLASATTTNTGDTIKITGAGGTALSSTNPGYVTLPGATAGTMATFKVTADVTILLTGAHWGAGTKGDLTAAVLHVYAINDSGTLKWGVAQKSNLVVALNADDSTTPSSITTAGGILVNSALGADAGCMVVGWFKANFDDTGGAAEDLWAIQTTVGNIGMGRRGLIPSSVYLMTGTTYPSTNIYSKRFTSSTVTGSGITYSDSGILGTYLRINEHGIYSMSYSDVDTAGTCIVGISVNGDSTNVITHANNDNDRLALQHVAAANNRANAAASWELNIGDIIQPHNGTGGAGPPNGTTAATFVITKAG